MSLYKDAGEATIALRDSYRTWTRNLTEWSIQLSYALLAANWAVFGTAKAILDSFCSTLSVVLVVLALTVNLIWAKSLSARVKARIEYAEQDHERWSNEFETYKTDKDWPFTESINSSSDDMRSLRFLLPIAAGAAFIAAVVVAQRG